MFKVISNCEWEVRLRLYYQSAKPTCFPPAVSSCGRRQKGASVLFRTSSTSARQCEHIQSRARAAKTNVRVGVGIRCDAIVSTQLASDDRDVLTAVRAGVADRRTTEIAAGAETP